MRNIWLDFEISDLAQFVTLFWNSKEDTCEITKVCFSAEKSEKLKSEAKVRLRESKDISLPTSRELWQIEKGVRSIVV